MINILAPKLFGFAKNFRFMHIFTARFTLALLECFFGSDFLWDMIHFLLFIKVVTLIRLCLCDDALLFG